MGINITDGFSLNAPKYLDSRQYFETLEEMKAFDVNLLPEGFETYCEGSKYKFLSTNTETAKTGKWRLIESGSGEVIDETITQIYGYIHATTKEKTDTFNVFIPSGGTWKFTLLANCQVQTEGVDNTCKISYCIEDDKSTTPEEIIYEGALTVDPDDISWTTIETEYATDIDISERGKMLKVVFDWTNKDMIAYKYLQFKVIAEHTTELTSTLDFLKYNMYLTINSQFVTIA